MHLRNFQRQCDVPMCVHTLGRTSTTLSYSWLSQIWCHLRNWLATCHERIRGLVSASWRPSCCSKVLGLGPPIAWNFSISSPWFLPPQLGHKEVWPVAQSPWRHVLPQLVHKALGRVGRSPLGTPMPKVDHWIFPNHWSSCWLFFISSSSSYNNA
jgi:hypothetical protein